MRKIVPLISMNQVDNYIKNGVDAVIMGTYFSGTRQPEVFDIEEMLEVNEKIDVIANFNRFYFEPEMSQVAHEIKALYEGGIDWVICGDFGILQVIHELNLDMNVIFSTDTTMTNIEEISILLENGASEVVVGRELTLEERLALAKGIKKPLGMSFFGYQLMSFSRRKHLTQYKELVDAPIDTLGINYIKESNRDDFYMIIEDTYGSHTFAPGVFSAIHAAKEIKDAGYTSLYFEVLGMDIEDVLFVVRSLDIVEDFVEFENIVKETLDQDLTHGLLYKETEMHKELLKRDVK
jgi:U32 family peptidase